MALMRHTFGFSRGLMRRKTHIDVGSITPWAGVLD